MVTIRKTPIVNTQRKMRKESKHKTKENYQIEGKRERGEQRSRKELQNSQNTIDKMAISTHLSIITLNVNRLNAPIKRHKVEEWIKKQNPSICCLQETHFIKRTHAHKNEGMEKSIP